MPVTSETSHEALAALLAPSEIADLKSQISDLSPATVEPTGPSHGERQALEFAERLALATGGVVLVRVGVLTADQAAGIKSWVIANPELAYTIGSGVLIGIREFIRKRHAS